MLKNDTIKIENFLKENGFIATRCHDSIIGSFHHHDDITSVVVSATGSYFYAVATEDPILPVVGTYFDEAKRDSDGNIHRLEESLAAKIFYNRIHCDRSKYLFLWNNDHSISEITGAIKDFKRKAGVI